MRSEIIKQILNEMDNQPWYKKLARWYRVRKWLLYCLIFNRKKNEH